jgi:hypothetical protein
MTKVVRKGNPIILRQPGRVYVAAIDPGGRQNAFTMVVLSKSADGRKRIDYANQWMGKLDGLDPKLVMEEVAAVCQSYGLGMVWADQYASDFVRSLGRMAGINVLTQNWTAKNRTEQFLDVAQEIAAGTLELPDDPLVLNDLASAYRNNTSSGSSIALPVSSDGRHADFFPPIAMALSKCKAGPVGAPAKQDEGQRIEEAKERAYESYHARLRGLGIR